MFTVQALGVDERKYFLSLGPALQASYQKCTASAKIFDLKKNKDLKIYSKTSNTNDPANGYSLQFIVAVNEVGSTEGYGEEIIDPAGKITKEQLATFLVRRLDMNEEAKATPSVNDFTVSDWAEGYFASTNITIRSFFLKARRRE
ncbi:hypothetical protein LOZ80_34650 [Paenibacillus sp. HWE-109]|uniref:hypothetical protein n=1 Tax=Paenibacillus sp. HWE-109 TaxID=1306526 RepID=UPI001EDDAADD|nr:hypothetical protein [Paenibacillus sp. HWE-109]UKS26599.1 hypothetical protein LOZ80_34650 [Paenibacillus sp. HWE-109]